MKQFRNKGWRYLEQMEDILPQGGATGALSYCGTIGVSAIRGESQQVTSESADSPTSVTGGSVVSNAPAVAFASGSTMAVNTSPSALFLPSLVPTSSSIATAGSRPSSKHPHSMISSDVADTSHLQSASLPPSSLPSAPSQISQGPSKRNRQKAATTDDKRSNVVAINAVNNSIRTLNDTITTQFCDKLTVVSTATGQLYQVPGLTSEQIMELGEYFAMNESRASVFLSLRQEERAAYAQKLYNQFCAPNLAAGPSV